MKKQSLLLMLLAVLFTASVTTSCKKSKTAPKDDDEQPGGGGGTTAKTGLDGSDYYLLLLDPTTEEKVHSKVTKDYRIDEANIVLNIWPGGDSYGPGNPSGPNAFGVVESWISLQVASLGWSGAGIATHADITSTVNLSGVTDDHVLHFAMKSKGDETHVISLGDGSNEPRIAIGKTPFNDNGNITPVYTDFKRDGEWHHIEIPISEFTKKGLKYRNEVFASAKNLFSFLSGGKTGTTIDIDGVFIYKPKK